MSNVYDLVLNFNKEYYAFYEWMQNDNILHLKKMPLVKTDINTFNDFMNYQIIVNKDFLNSFHNKSEYFTKNNLKILPYAFLISDSYRAMGIILDNNGKVTKYSSLLLDEEEEILELSLKLPIVKFSYKKTKKKKISHLSREEERIQQELKRELDICNQDDDFAKIRYLYFEYYGKNPDNQMLMKQELMNELMNNFNEKHISLYQLLKKSLHQNNV